MLSEHHHLSDRLSISSDESLDEIVYTISEGPLSLSNVSLPSDDDFVVLSRPRSLRAAPQSGPSTPGATDGARTPNTERLADDLAKLTVSDSESPDDTKPPRRYPSPPPKLEAPESRRKGKAARKAAAKVAADPSPAQSMPPSSVTKQGEPRAKAKSGKKKTNEAKKAKKASASPPGFTTRSIVDDISERLSVHGETESGMSVYEEAVGYITSFLSNPAARNDSACRLTLLQALIIELGLSTPSLPASLRSATAFLKSHAFLNIKEYLAVRGQGPAAVQRIMYPTRSALIRDIRKKKNRASLQWVKESGLQVLLVSCYR